MFVEIVTFKAKAEFSDAEVVASARTISDLASGYNADYRLEIYKTSEGEWVEIVYWNSQTEAQSVEQQVMSLPEALEAMRVMEEGSLRMMFLHPAV